LRRASKVDSTQAAIVEALRRVGVWVLHLHQLGGGTPDLLCWNRGRYVLVECKSPGEKINALQAQFMAECPGEIHVCQSPDEALRAVLGAEVMK
jgi:hypothetical protein